MNYDFLIRALLGLSTSIWLVRSARGYIRKTVLRHMPVDQRISENGLQVQNRRSTIIAAVMILLLSCFFTWGIGRVQGTLSRTPTPTKRTNTNEEPVKITPLSPFEKEERITIKPDQESEIPESPSTEPSLISPAKPTDIIDRPSYRTNIQETTFYIQVHALSQARELSTTRDKLQTQHRVSVKTAFIQEDLIPYKILLGPFESQQAALNYRNRYATQGWIRVVPTVYLL